MKKLRILTRELWEQAKKDDLISIANDMTYKIFFALFPFIIFIMSVVGFLELDAEKIIGNLSLALPQNLLSPMERLIKEVVGAKHPNILSFSLIIALLGASAGFGSAVKGINKAYGQKDARSLIIKMLINIALVIVFTCSVILSFVMLVFRDSIIKLSRQYSGAALIVHRLFGIFGYTATVSIMFLFVVIINKLALSQKASYKLLAPGSLLTVALWLTMSKFFNIYINNFARYSLLYGSLGGIMALMIWLNGICVALILGSEVNAMLQNK